MISTTVITLAFLGMITTICFQLVLGVGSNYASHLQWTAAFFSLIFCTILFPILVHRQLAHKSITALMQENYMARFILNINNLAKIYSRCVYEDLLFSCCCGIFSISQSSSKSQSIMTLLLIFQGFYPITVICSRPYLKNFCLS